MGCCGDREKQEYLKTEQKWEYVDLDTFKSSSCLTPLAYGYLWIMLMVSVSVYAVDTFTCINLLVFDKWAGQIEPAIPLRISRWIFAGCIILSFLLLIYRWIRAIRVMRAGGVAKSYLDPLAVRIQSIRMGQQGRGWKRFLVFAELTKSRKGADYVALFAYYSFEAWLRIVFAEGPRQVLNGFTIYSMAKANLVPEGDHAAAVGQSPFVKFWLNVGALADTNRLQVVVLFGMLWTLIIWVISALSLIISVILYLIFLWHHIPSQDGGLTGYCRGKINRRMEKIVRVKVDKALKKENELRARQEAKAVREGRDVKRQPTLPNFEPTHGGSTPTLPDLSRQTTMTTLQDYPSRPGTGRSSQDTLPPIPTPADGPLRPLPKRHMTQSSDASWSSYNSNAPLISSAGDMGYSPADRAQTPSSAVSTSWSARPGTNRSFTGTTQYSDRTYTPGASRPSTAQSGRNTPGAYQMEPLPRPGTASSHRSRPSRQSSDSERTMPPPRGMTPMSGSMSSTSSRGPQWPTATDNSARRTPANINNPYFPPVSPIPELQGSEPFVPKINTPYPSSTRSLTPQGFPTRTLTPASHAPPLPRAQTPSSANSSSYIAFNSGRANTPVSNEEEHRFYGQPMFNRSERSVAMNGDATRKPPPPQRDGSVDDILNYY